MTVPKELPKELYPQELAKQPTMVPDNSVTDGSPSDPLIAALEEYREMLDRGEQPDRDKFLQRHASIANDLQECLDSLDFLQFVAPQLCQDPEATADQLSSTPQAAIGDFRIIREIGRGGMGVVYEAEQLSLSRRVALKVLPFAAVLDQKQLQRFKNEAMAAAQLDHPHVVDVIGVGCDRGVHYYAMRYIDGKTLAEIIDQLRDLDNNHTTSAADPAVRDGDTQAMTGISTQLSSQDPQCYKSIARLAVQVAVAIDHAHQQGVVHRDIKPSNLIIDEKGQPWVTDFGLAQFETDQSLTMTGDLVGTLRYMSPEQVLAKRVEIDHRTDIYSLGVTLYELLTLRPAFEGGDRHELLRQIAFEDPPLVRRLNKSTPIELETLLHKAMAKNPSDRYATAAELADDLRRFLDDQPILARRPNWRDYVTKWSRRHRRFVFWAVAVLVMVSVVSTLASFRMAAALQRAEVAEQGLRSAKLGAESREEQAKKSEQIWSLLYKARGVRLSGWRGQRTESFAALREAAKLLPDLTVKDDYLLQLRNEAIACLALTDVSETRPLESSDTICGPVTLDQRFVRYAYRSEHDEMVVRQVADDSLVLRLPAEPNFRFALPQLSPNGRFMLVGNHHKRLGNIWDVDQGRLVNDEPLPFHQSVASFSSDSRWIAVGGMDGVIRVLDLTGEVPDVEFQVKSTPAVARFQPHSDHLAVSYHGGSSVEIWESRTGEQLQSLSTAPDVVSAVTFSPNAKTLAVGCINGNIHILDVENGEPSLPVIHAHDAQVIDLSFGHLNGALKTISHDRTSQLWDVLSGRCLVKTVDVIRGFSGGNRQCCLQVGSQLSVADVLPSRIYRSTRGKFGSLSGDGRILALIEAASVALIDTNTLATLARIPWQCQSVLFDGETAFYTFSDRGVHRWPVQPGNDDVVVRFGPPQLLSHHSISPLGAVSISRTPVRLAWISDQRQVTVCDLSDNSEITLEMEGDITSLTLHPTGTQLVVNAWDVNTGEAFGYDVWDIDQQVKITHLDGGGSGWWGRVQFHPSGDRLLTGPDRQGRGYTQWAFESWEPIRQIDGASGVAAWTNDGQMLATDDRSRQGRMVRLLAAESLKTIAELVSPTSHLQHRFFFQFQYSDDGHLLAVAADPYVDLWNLRTVREELSKIDLDWDLPRIPDDRLPPVKSIRVELGDLRER